MRDLVTLPSGVDAFERFKDEEKKIIKLIDVLWFREEDGELIPHCAFEVEHSTNVLTGLERLNHLPKIFQTHLFIVGRDEPKKAKFDALMKSPTWKKNASRFNFRFFEDVHSVFSHAALYQQARDANNEAMEQFVG